MTAASPSNARAFEDRAGPFELIVCGVDGSPSSLEGVRQAGVLAGVNTTIELVAVTDEWSVGPQKGALLREPEARAALARATALLAHSPARVVSRVVGGLQASETLIKESRGADLLVVGRHGHSRIGGILMGSTATFAVHSAPAPVLVAARPPEHQSFPGRILVAADGPDHPEAAVELASRIARHSGGTITLLRVDWGRRAKRPAIADAVAGVPETIRAEPYEVVVGGRPKRTIPDYAEHEHVSLVVIGSRELGALSALRSVSERVAHHASCSVLVTRGQWAVRARR